MKLLFVFNTFILTKIQLQNVMSVVLELMNCTVKQTGLSTIIQNFILRKKLSHTAVEDFNVRAQNRHCITSLFIFEFNEFCYVLYVYFVLFLNLFRDSLNPKGRKTVILLVVG